MITHAQWIAWEVFEGTRETIEGAPCFYCLSRSVFDAHAELERCNAELVGVFNAQDVCTRVWITRYGVFRPYADRTKFKTIAKATALLENSTNDELLAYVDWPESKEALEAWAKMTIEVLGVEKLP